MNLCRIRCTFAAEFIYDLTKKLMRLSRLFSAWTLVLCTLSAQGQVKIDFDFKNRGQQVTEDHYGIFFEEINHAGDGGLYAELVRNRSFEEDMNSPLAWSAAGNATISLSRDNMLNTIQRRALRVDVKSAGGGVRNEGYWGMNIVKGRKYSLSFWLRAEDTFKGVITAELQNAGGGRLGQTAIDVSATREWQKLTATIVATGNEAQGRLMLRSSVKGVLYLDVVSLFPPTFKNRPNGCREDLAQMLADLHPRFMRFPGGCYIEGAYADGATNRFEWKKSVGPIEERPGHLNRNWGYKVTDGLGYHELLQLAEDLGAHALFVVNMGIGHDWKVDEDNIDPFIQEALDAIEYANGSATETFYGRLRAQNGHPEPFDLKYLEISNEQEFMLNRDDYMRRYMQFYTAIKTRWPELHLVADSYYFDNVTEPVELKDEHYYDTPDFFISQYGRYDNQSKSSTHIYVGEYAVTKDCGFWGNMNAAIGEAVFMQGCENNSESVNMMSYAPIFTHEENYAWRPDMIRFNSSLSYGTPSYYVQRMFSNNIGQQNIRWSEQDNDPALNATAGSIGLGTWSTSATFTDLSVTASDTTFEAKNLVASEWTTKGGNWTLSDATFRQTNSSAADVTCVLNTRFTTTNVDMTVHATKNGGAEGFLIIFDYKDAQNYSWLNLGGWGNTKHAVEQCKNGVKSTLADKEGQLKTGQEYTIRVQKEGQRVRCYLNGTQIIDTNLREYANRRIFTSASIDEQEGIFYVKLVNPHPVASPVRLSFANGRALSGEAEVLSAPDGTDENTLTKPFFITPHSQAVRVEADGTVNYEAAAFSVNVLRLKVTDVGVPVAEPLPQPRLRFSFEGGEPVDDSGTYRGTLAGKASIEQQSDGNHVLSTGQLGEKSYMSLPIKAVQDALAGATDYTISLNVLQRIGNNTNNFSWALELSNGTNQYFGIINSGSNNNWYCELKSTATTSNISSWSCLRIGEWHNITCTQKDGTFRLYVDGQLRRTQAINVSLPELVAKLKVARIAHSPFSADAIMEHALFDDFQIFDCALSDLQVQEMAARATAMHDDARFQGIADLQELQNLVKEVKNYYKDAGNSALTQAYNAASRAVSSGTAATRRQRLQQLLSAVADYQEEQLQRARSGQPADLTFLIKNSSFTRYNVGWQGTDIPAVRTGTDITTTYVGYNSETAEQFSRPFDIWQELTGLPAGYYQLSANAFYRAGAIEPAYAAWQQHDPSIEYAQLYLGDISTPLQNLYSCEDYTYNPYRYPDDLAAASKAFTGNERYCNSVTCLLPAEQQSLRLGIRKKQTVDADWVAYDHFQLHYLGDGTGIHDLPFSPAGPFSPFGAAVPEGSPEGSPFPLYDLTGRRLPAATTQHLNNLPAGVYIIAGKKYISHK